MVRRRSIIGSLPVLCLLVALAGCGPEPTGPSPTDASHGDDADPASDTGVPDTGGDTSPDDTSPDRAIRIDEPTDGALTTETSVAVSATIENPETIAELGLRVDRSEPLREQLASDRDGPATHTFADLDLSAHDATEEPVDLRVVGYDPDGDAVDRSRRIELLVDTRKTALDRLDDQSETEPIVRWNRNGLPDVAQFDLPTEGDNPVDKGLHLFEQWKELFRLDTPDEVLALGDINTRDDGRTEVQFQQHLGALPVVGAAMTLTLDGDRAIFFTGHYVEDLPTDTDVRIGQPEAETIALDAVEGTGLYTAGYTRRVVYDPAIFDSRADADPTVAWRVTVRGVLGAARGDDGELLGLPVTWRVFVNADTGAVMASHSNYREGNAKDLRVKVLNARGKRRRAGASICMSKTVTRTKPACFKNINLRNDGCNSNADGDGDCRDALEYGREIHRWLNDHFGWKTNKEGGIIKPFTNVQFQNGPNAASISGGCNNQLHFSDGWVVRDVFHHEFGHRLVHSTDTDFNDTNQPGALDEHIGDVVAALVEGEQKGNGFDPIQGDKLPSSGVPPRNLRNPNAGVSRCFGGPRPAHMSNYNAPNCDDGAVHANSLIPSRATYLLAKGGSQRGWTFDSPVGPDRLRTALWKTLSSSQTSSATNFAQYASTMVQEARQTYSMSTGCEFRNAFAAVGILTGDADCDGSLDGAESDDDDDGVGDGSDNCPKMFNPSQRDSDGDGTGDACSTDNDGDGVPDAQDNCPERPNSSQNDADSNGVGDMCEDSDGDLYDGHEDNCPTVSNFFQEDRDGDGVGDKCDDDTDGDGIDNGPDNCPTTPNSGQMDQDGDGVGDPCDDEDDDGILDVDDNCPNTPTPDQADNDGDGKADACDDPNDDTDDIPDKDDNCPTTPNPDQDDSDGDGIGDACDDCFNSPGPTLDGDNDGIPDHCDHDNDQDGILDEVDNCPHSANTRQRDFDDDGLGDRCTNEIPAWAEGGAGIAGEIVARPCEPGGDNLKCDLGISAPIDICKSAECEDKRFVPEGLQKSVELSSTSAFAAAVVDGRGDVIRSVGFTEVPFDGSTETFKTTITFEPEQDAHFETDSADRGVFQGRTYKLRVLTDEEYASDEQQSIDIESRETVEGP